MPDNQLIKINDPFDPLNRQSITIPHINGKTVGDLIDLSGMGGDIIVYRNGVLCKRYNQLLLPGDVVHICPRLHDSKTARSVSFLALAVAATYVLAPAVSAAVGGGVWGGIAGGLAAAVTVTAGGMIINSGLSSPSTSNKTGSEGSLTYDLAVTSNPSREGLAIPVVYGEVSTYPEVINRWIEADNATGLLWLHMTLCVAEGLTNNVPTADDIYVGEKQLSFYSSDDYVLQCTDGGASPDWDSKTDFTTPYQLRVINQSMKQAIISSILLRCNGADASTTITDDAEGETNIWTCENTAQLSTASPKFGTAQLDLEGTDDYISCDNEDAFDIWTSANWSIECWWKQTLSAQPNSAIIGQQRVVGAGDEYYWALWFDNVNNDLIFQQYKVTSGGVYTVYWNVSENVNLGLDTWRHILAMKYGNKVYLYVDGTLLGSGSPSTTAVAPPAGTWAQAVGKCQIYTTGPEADSTLYGSCQLDDIRVVPQAAVYNISSYTAPAAELPDDTASSEYFYTTKGVTDGFTVIIKAPYGIYWALTDGTLDPHYVQFWINYRKVGDTEWTRQNCLFYGTSRNPYSMQFPVTGLDRDTYEISIGRGSADHTDLDTRAQTTTIIAYINEYLSLTLTYPYLQCVGLSIKASDGFQGTIQPVRVKSNRDSIVVPTYDAASTQIVDPTTNAYAALDALTNTVYGGGVSAARIVEDDWNDWIDWTEGLVATYKRAQFNMVFDSVSTLDNALQHIEGCGRGKIVKRGTNISVNIDQPSSPVALFGVGNIKPQTDYVRWLRQAERADVTEISYRDKDLNFAENAVTAYSSGYHSLTRVPRIVRLRLLGINNEEQAEREAILRQQINDGIKKSLELQSGLEAIPVTSGDIINYQASINSYSGRLKREPGTNDEEYIGSRAYLDKEINLDTSTFDGNCILMVWDPDDTIQTYTVEGPFDEDVWYVDIEDSAATFNYLSNYIICRSTGDVYQYKIAEIGKSNKLDVKIVSLQYDATDYYNGSYEGGAVAI